MRLIKKIIEWILKLFGVKKKEDKPEQPEEKQPAPRGLSMIPGMVPNARPAMDTVVDVLKRAKIPHAIINVLIGRGFGDNPLDVNHYINEIGNSGKDVSLLVYLTSGPNQRDYKNGKVNGLGDKIHPADFRSLILRREGWLIREYISLLTNFRIVFESVRRFNGTIYICPALEDNLTVDTFNILADIARTQMEVNGFINFKIVRNPSPKDKRWGNDTAKPANALMERHYGEFDHQPRDILTNDGATWVLPGQEWRTNYQVAGQRRVFPLMSFREVRDIATKEGVPFILWCDRMQGLQGGGQLPAVDQRVFMQLEQDEQKALIEFLEEGIVQE